MSQHNSWHFTHSSDLLMSVQCLCHVMYRGSQRLHVRLATNFTMIIRELQDFNISKSQVMICQCNRHDRRHSGEHYGSCTVKMFLNFSMWKMSLVTCQHQLLPTEWHKTYWNEE